MASASVATVSPKPASARLALLASALPAEVSVSRLVGILGVM
jgi:hypothetical protein